MVHLRVRSLAWTWHAPKAHRSLVGCACVRDTVVPIYETSQREADATSYQASTYERTKSTPN